MIRDSRTSAELAVLGIMHEVRSDGCYILDNIEIAAIQADWDAQALFSARDAQIKLINDACRMSIISGSVSDALGTPHLYPCNNTPENPDQSNMEGSVTESITDRQNAASWTANDATVVVGDPVAGYRTVGGAVLEAVAVAANGTTGATAPAVPAVGAQVVDGGVTWKLWTTPFVVQDIATGTWAFVDHTEHQIQHAGKDMKAHILTNRVRCKTLIDQINAAATVAAVQAIVW